MEEDAQLLTLATALELDIKDIIALLMLMNALLELHATHLPPAVTLLEDSHALLALLDTVETELE